MSTRKYRYPTRQAAEERAVEQEKLVAVNRIALNGLMRGELYAELKDGPYRVLVINPTRCDGGVVIVEHAPEGQKAYSAAYYLDDWVDDMLRAYAYANTPEECALRRLAFDVRLAQNRAFDEERSRPEYSVIDNPAPWITEKLTK